MAKVLIDRELLERAASMELDTTARSIRIQDELRAILAQPVQQGEAVEVAQVFSYLSACADGYDPDAPHPGPPEPLMTVAQHQRFLVDYATLEAERDALRGRLDVMTQCADNYSRMFEESSEQRDKLAKVLEDVEREHALIRRMKNCEMLRGRGSFGIAVMSDPPALEWQALDKELQQFVDARRAALAAELGDAVSVPAELVQQQQQLVECDHCPTSGGCVGVCMKAQQPTEGRRP